MRLSYDGEPCPAIVKTGPVPQGCEGYSKTPQMIEAEKKGTGPSTTTILGGGLLVLAAAFVTYTFLFSRR